MEEQTHHHPPSTEDKIAKLLLDRIEADVSMLNKLGYPYEMPEFANGAAKHAEKPTPTQKQVHATKQRWARFHELGGKGIMTAAKLEQLEKKAEKKAERKAFAAHA